MTCAYSIDPLAYRGEIALRLIHVWGSGSFHLCAHRIVPSVVARVDTGHGTIFMMRFPLLSVVIPRNYAPVPVVAWPFKGDTLYGQFTTVRDHDLL